MKKIFILLLVTIFSLGYAQNVGDFQTWPLGVTWPKNWNTEIWQVYTSTGWQDTSAYPGQTPGNYRVTILSGDEVNTGGLASVTIGNLYVKGILHINTDFTINTFGTGPAPYLFIENGTVYMHKNVTLRLPVGSNVYINITNPLTQGIHEKDGCSGSTRIVIGSNNNTFTACQGNSGPLFQTIMPLTHQL